MPTMPTRNGVGAADGAAVPGCGEVVMRERSFLGEGVGAVDGALDGATAVRPPCHA